MLLYYITDRIQFLGDAATQRSLLLGKIAEATRAGVDYIQLRERDLSTKELGQLAADALRTILEATAGSGRAARFLINSRTDVALATGADGVHLRSNDVSPQIVRQVWAQSGAGTPIHRAPEKCIIAISCHSSAEVHEAKQQGADYAVFAPVFEKKDVHGAQPTGLVALRKACQARIPVFALGGVTLQNAPACIETGASGIAGIRLFQENDISKVVRTLRGS